MDGMETTFISIHDLDPECRIMYCSDSVMDVLGYEPDDIVEKSCWEFFHPDEIPLARAKHGRSVMMDKAAVLSYCRMKHSDGSWIGCEVVFTIVYDVLVGCTSIYNRGLRADARAAEAPGIRRVFSTNPRDPRYHMLQHLSTKFTTMPRAATMREPRAALFLNRYTRTLTVMYATDGLADVLGINGDELRGLSFYFCMTDNCLPDAIKCLENAKANDSIAYLRFWYDEPRGKDGTVQRQELERFDRESSADADVDGESVASGSRQSSPENGSPVDASISAAGSAHNGAGAPLRASSSSGVDSTAHTHEAVFGERQASDSTATTNSVQSHSQSQSPGRRIELEAVISCTSDGLVVCLRVAQPVVNHSIPGLAPDQRSYAPQRIASFDPQPQTVFSPLHQRNVAAQQRQNNAARVRTPRSAGVYAVPWSTEPMLPPPQHQARAQPTSSYARSGYDSDTYPQSTSTQQDFMNSIQEMAVFAWAIVGINGTFADYSVGTPRGMAQPPAGLSIWKPDPSISLASDGCVANHQLPGHMLRNGGPGSGLDGGHASTVETQNGRSTQSDTAYASYTTQPPPSGSNSASSSSGTNFGASPANTAGGQMVDGYDNNHNFSHSSLQHDRTLPGFEQFKQANRSPTAPMVDGVGQMVDGVGSPTSYRHGSTSSSDKTPGSNNFGFKDPGSSSKNTTTNFYNPALQNLAPGKTS